MKRLFIIAAFMCLQMVSAQEAEVKKAVETFFVGFNGKDVDKVKSVCSDRLILHSVEVHAGGNKITEETSENFFKWLQDAGTKIKFEERIKEYKIQTDGHIAHVWAPYEFYINGKLSHKGVDSFELIRVKDGWKILYLIDTRIP
jgi:ketosteroid isomerase-like protein